MGVVGFGLKSAIEHYQKTIQQILQGCEGVKNISNDLIIHGNKLKQHDERLFAVLDKLKQSGLTAQGKMSVSPE